MKANACATFLTTLCLLYSLTACEAKQATAPEQNPSKQTSTAGSAQKEMEATTSPLISVAELKKLIESDAAGVKILEPAKSLNSFEQGHLPGAQFIDWVADMTDPEQADRYNAVMTNQFAGLMSKLGVQNDDQIIIYDRLNSRLSTRLFWTLKYYGHKRVQVLDGGYELWKSKSFPLTKEVADVTKSEYKVSAVAKKLLAKVDFVESQLNEPNSRMVDGRPPAQFSGEKPGRVFHTRKDHPRRGHIPGAANVYWADNFNKDGTFKTAKELRRLYANANVKPNNDVITYCNEGLHAAPPWFVLTQLLDYPNVRLYDSSMAEWAKTKLPLKTDVKEELKK